MNNKDLLDWFKNKNGVICSNGVFINMSQIQKKHLDDISLIHIVYSKIDHLNPSIFSLKNIKKIEILNCNLYDVNIKKCNAEEINLQKNQIKNFNLKSNTIRNLYLDNNKITKIKLYTPNLEILSLTKNSINEFSFKNNKKIIHLITDENIPVYKNSSEEKLLTKFRNNPTIIQKSKILDSLF